MARTPDRHHRRSIRLKGYDYSSPGAYFVTICTQHRECMFGDIVDGVMRLNDAGGLVQAAWEDMAVRFPTVGLDAFVVMPNHVHGIVMLDVQVESGVDEHGDGGCVGGGRVAEGRGAASSAPTGGLEDGVEAHGCNDADGYRVGALLAAPRPSATHSPDGSDDDAQAHGRNDADGYRVGGGRGAASSAPTCDRSESLSPTRANTAPPPTLGQIVRAFKSISAIAVNRHLHRDRQPLWQRNYYEHIVRDPDALCRVRQYIHDNPARWVSDRNNPVVSAITGAIE